MGKFTVLRNEAEHELLNHILPFWAGLRDSRGGFYGFLSYDLELKKDAPKGGILHSRILWFFSNLHLMYKTPETLELAEHAYKYIRDYMLDKKYGGIYWTLTADNTPDDTVKHTYNQAFSVYALSSYYDASKKKEALELALAQFRLIEEKCTDEYGYKEAFNEDWTETGNEKLSEGGYDAKKSMNTLLHIIEAYTELYRVSGDAVVGGQLKKVLRICLDKVYDSERKYLRVFFDTEMNEISDIHSYGHDIEAAWLLDRACEILNDGALIKEMLPVSSSLTETIISTAFKDGVLYYQCQRGEITKDRVWWALSEGIVGSLNEYQKGGGNRYLDVAYTLWNYIKNHIIDKRNGSEWLSELDENDLPSNRKPIVEPWKCPYHNGRMCMEVIKRHDKK